MNSKKKCSHCNIYKPLPKEQRMCNDCIKQCEAIKSIILKRYDGELKKLAQR